MAHSNPATPAGTGDESAVDHLADDAVDTLVEQVTQQAHVLATDHGWSAQAAAQGALDNVLDDRGYHAPEARNVERVPLEHEIRTRLPLNARAALGFTRRSCRFEPADVIDVPAGEEGR